VLVVTVSWGGTTQGQLFALNISRVFVHILFLHETLISEMSYVSNWTFLVLTHTRCRAACSDAAHFTNQCLWAAARDQKCMRHCSNWRQHRTVAAWHSGVPACCQPTVSSWLPHLGLKPALMRVSGQIHRQAPLFSWVHVPCRHPYIFVDSRLAIVNWNCAKYSCIFLL